MAEPPNVDDPLVPFRTLLEKLSEFATLCDKVVEVHARGDREQTRVLIDQSRKARLALSLAQEGLKDLSLPSSIEAVEILIKTRELIGRVSAGDQIIYKVVAESFEDVSTNEELFARPGGEVMLVDRILPGRWDFDLDIAVFTAHKCAHVAKELIRRGQKRLVVYESETPAPGDYPSGATVVTTLTGLVDAVAAFIKPPPTQMAFLHIPSPSLTAELQNDIHLATRDVITQLLSLIATVNSLGESWILQGIANFPTIASVPSINHLRKTFEGKPMVICAPGPSLAKNIETLKAFKGKATILAFSQTLGALRKADITPDFVMLVDPSDLRYHFEGSRTEDIPGLIIGVTCFPALYSLPFKHKITYAGNTSLEDWIYSALNEDARVPAGGTVAHSAYSLAVAWNCDPIIFVGLDLSYPNGQAYVQTGVDGGARMQFDADGKSCKLEGSRFPWEKMSVHYVDGYYGDKVPTSSIYSQFILWFATRTHEVNSRLRIFNCTEGGAFVKGMEHIPLRDALDRIADQTIDVGALLDATLQNMDLVDRRSRLLQRLNDVLQSMERCTQLANECDTIVEDVRADTKHLPALDKKEAELIAALKPVLFISLLQQRALREAVDAGSKGESLEQLLESSKKLFEIVRSSDRLIRPPLLQAKREIEEALLGGTAAAAATAGP